MFSCHGVPGGAEPMTLSQLMTNPHHHCRSCCMWGSFFIIFIAAILHNFYSPLRCCDILAAYHTMWEGTTSRGLIGAAVLLRGSKGGCEIHTVIKGSGSLITEWPCGIVSSLSAGNQRCPHALVPVPGWSGSARTVERRAGRWSLVWGKGFRLGDWPARVLCKCFSLHTNHLEENTSC